MARIRSFDKSRQDVKRHPTEVDCEYAVVDDGDEKLLHLSTFGSDYRASEKKSSQSIQLNREMAKELMRILEEAFPGLRRA